jgi:double-stranded uracil-DNA glycosylase
MVRRRNQRGQLPDRLCSGARILFVGINPGLRSAALGHHFAGASNRFWKLLFQSGLVDKPLTYEEDWRLPEWQLGLTNIIARPSVGIEDLKPVEYRAGVISLERKIRRYRPQTVALLGVTIFRMVFPHMITVNRLEVGLTQARLAGSRVFLLPNPSGRNAHYSYHGMLSAFVSLRKQTE